MIEIIAEIGQNHNGDMNLAKELIDAAKENGADVAKFQLFDAPTLFPSTKPWFDYNCKTQLSKDNVNELSEYCTKVDIEFMASVFDIERIKWLEDVNVLRYKIASRSIKEDSLIKELIKTKKPLLASLGMWEEENFPLILDDKANFLFCISKYPTELEDFNFSNIDFNNKYSGFSDHSIGIVASCVAMSRGAQIIEKHFTLDKKMEGPDHAGSMIPNELKEIVLFKNDLIKCL
jgi:sialic acid synthase SpsE